MRRELRVGDTCPLRCTDICTRSCMRAWRRRRRCRAWGTVSVITGRGHMNGQVVRRVHVREIICGILDEALPPPSDIKVRTLYYFFKNRLCNGIEKYWPSCALMYNFQPKPLRLIINVSQILSRGFRYTGPTFRISSGVFQCMSKFKCEKKYIAMPEPSNI